MEYLDQIVRHWAFVAVAVVFGLIGVVMNKRVFTEKQAKVKRKSQWLWWWGRKTLPLHPVASGFFVAFFWKLPEPGVDRLIERLGYFGLAGAVSVFGYELLKGLAKKKGLDLELPGESSPPPTPETTT